MSNAGQKSIADALDSAVPGAKDRHSRNKPGKDSDGLQVVQWDMIGLPDDSPLRAVGKTGTTCIFLDALHQLSFADPRELGEAYLTDYFGADMDYLRAYWPRYGKDGIITFSAEDCRRSIQRECADEGIWSDMEKVRGRGAWRASDGGLVLHCGDVVHIGGKMEDPGVHDGSVYPGRPHMQGPALANEKLPVAHGEQAAAHKIYAMLKTWNFRRGALDARLFLGMMIAGFAGGALTWRPSGWITGESGCGKSTLIDLRRDIMGAWSLNASNATAPSVYRAVEYDAIAVSLDEQENGKNGGRLADMIELARDAASGDMILRASGKNSASVSFRARNCFLFSSINAAPLRNQDMNRMPQLELFKLSKDAVQPEWTLPQAKAWGRELLRRLMDNWPRWDDTLAAHRAELKKLGHDARGQNTFGVLLALADLVMSEHGYLSHDDARADDPDVEIWESLRPALLTEYVDAVDNWRACVGHLLSSRPREWKTPGPASIGGVAAKFMEARKDGFTPDGVGDFTIGEANAMLALAGCAIKWDGMFGSEIFIANQHPGLLTIFDGSDWPGIPNARGPWIQAITKGPPDIVRQGRMRCDGQQHRGVFVKIDHVVSWVGDGKDIEEEPEES